MTTDEIQERAKSAAAHSLSAGGLGLLSTASMSGEPHATWMATIGITEHNEIVTLTSPDSRKVENIQSNPKVEWLLSSEDLQNLVYLYGSARIVNDPKEVKIYWDLMPEKDRAYFLDFFNSGPGFSIILTEIAKAKLVCPREGETHIFDHHSLWEHSQPDANT